MKSYKTTNNLSKNINYIKYQQSDIFSQKGLNKPEIKYTHKKLIPKKTFESSYNFLEWRDMSPHYDQSIKVKLNPNNISQILSSKTNQYLNYDLNKINPKKISRKNFIQRLFETEPEKVMNQSNSLNKNLNKRYQKETLFIGDYDGDEYKIKRTKSVIKEPPINFGEQNPLNKKMEIIYGGNENIIGDSKPLINLKKNMIRSKSCLGFLKKEFETNNDHDNNIINDPKKMKYFNIYGNNGIENANKKLKSLNVSHSMNNIYTPKNSCKQNRINFLKSNIFNNEEENEKDKNKINNNHNNHTIKVNRHLQKNKKYKRANSASKLINKYYTNKNNNEIKNNNDSIINNKNISIIKEINNNARKFLYKNNGEDNLPVKLDWRDEKSHLLFPQNKNRDILKKNCRQRKFKNLYDSEPILPKEKLGQEFKSDKRSEIEKMAKNYYKNKNYAKIRKLSDNISQFQIEGSNKVLNDINYNTENIQGIKYEIIKKN